MDIRVPSTFLNRAVLPSWNAEQDDRLVCVDVRQETHDVRTFTFAAMDGAAFEFSAGQYLTFDIEIDGEIESRCYSISSSPHRRKAIGVTVKRISGGKVSNWLHDHLKPNMIVRARGPMGQFLLPSAPAGKFLFLSGGSGITPLMAILRDLADLARPVDLVFFHAARTPRDIVFRDELGLLADRLPGLRLLFLPEDCVGERSWSGLTGRLSPAYLSLAVPDLAERAVMCCGPAPFMAAAREMVAGLGVKVSDYYEESFDAAVLEEDCIVKDAAETSRVFQVTFSKQARTIEVADDQTVLSAAKKAGIRIPSSCANGLCGTCKSKLSSGAVDMKHGGGIRQREVEAGYFLPCCSKPLGDLVIER